MAAEEKYITPHLLQEVLSFAQKARQAFEDHPEWWTYQGGEGCDWIAIRWGMEPAKNHSIRILKLDPDVQGWIIGDLDKWTPPLGLISVLKEK